MRDSTKHHSMRVLVGLVALAMLLGCAPQASAPTAGILPSPTSIPPTATIHPTATLKPLGPEPAPTSNASATAPLPSPTTAPTAEPTATAQARPMPPVKGATAFDFALETLDGTSLSLSDLRGTHVMLNFWATWCGPCRAEIPHMVTLYQELADEDFEILAVNLREDEAKVKTFVDEYEMEFPIMLDFNGLVGSYYFVRGIPTSVFINPEGVIEAVHVGTLSDEALRNYVSELLK